MSELVPRRGRNLHRNIAVTPFLNKLYNIVDDNASNDLIRWSAEGNSFVVVRHEDFAKEVLPHFFKHNNFSSFVRQLNMYGFHKVPHLQHGGLIADNPDAECWEFSNEHFQRGKPDLLHYIHRKKGNRDSTATGLDLPPDDGQLFAHKSDAEGDPSASQSRAPQPPPPPPLHSTGTTTAGLASGPSKAMAVPPPLPTPPPPPPLVKGADPHSAKARPSRAPAPPVNLASVLKEIQVIRDHQMTISSDIKRLQDENQSLWMQARTTEDRHIKHQETIDKILRFLATVFSADARHSELRPPLRRLISHNARPRRSDDSSADEPQHTGRTTPWAQSVFDEMDFPDTLSAAQPPDKRQRTGCSPRSPLAHQPAAGAADPGSNSRPLQRSGSSTQLPSTALTRVQPWNLLSPLLHSPRSPGLAPRSSSSSSDNGRLQAQSESINQLSQKVDSLGVSLESLTRQLNSGLLSQLLGPHSAGDPMSADGLGMVSFPSSVAPQDILTDRAGSLPSASLTIPGTDINALFNTDALGSLELPLGDTELLSAGQPGLQSQLPCSGSMGSMDLTPFVGVSHGSPGSVLTTGPATGGHAEHGGGTGAGGRDAGIGGGVNLNELQDMLKSPSTKEYQNMIQGLFELANNPDNAHLLAGGGTDASYHHSEASPFLDFVDPNAHAGMLEDDDGADEITDADDVASAATSPLGDLFTDKAAESAADAAAATTPPR